MIDILTRLARRRLAPYRGGRACAGGRQRRRPRPRVRRAPPARARLRVHRGPPRAPRRLAGARRRRAGADARLGVERLPARDGRARRGRGGARARGRRRGRARCSAICFGAQVLAHALGGTVSRTPTPEIGWFDVDRRRRRRSPPGRGWSGTTTCSRVPEGFDVLARTAVGPQLVRGGRCLATQFHPEATETMVRRWLGDGRRRAVPRARRRPGRAAGRDQGQRRAQPARRRRRWSTGSSTTSPPLSASAGHA